MNVNIQRVLRPVFFSECLEYNQSSPFHGWTDGRRRKLKKKQERQPFDLCKVRLVYIRSMQVSWNNSNHPDRHMLQHARAFHRA